MITTHLCQRCYQKKKLIKIRQYKLCRTCIDTSFIILCKRLLDVTFSFNGESLEEGERQLTRLLNIKGHHD